jgi:small subunit ribosomal protein S24e
VIPLKIDILRERDNKPVGRREIDFRIEHIGGTTPSRVDVKAKLAALLNADPSCVAVKVYRTKFGVGITEGSARVYSSAEALKQTEAAYVLERHEPKKKETEGEAERHEPKKKETEAKPKKKEEEDKPRKKETEGEA